MGDWTLQSVTATFSNLDRTDKRGAVFGHNFIAVFRLAYKSSTFGSFKEPPVLDWHEKFVMKEHEKGEWWEYEGNMFRKDPDSESLRIWPARYVEAYKAAVGMPSGVPWGSARLLNKNGAILPRNNLKPGIANPAKQADAVRSYLKSHSGILEVTVHDVPNIVERDNQHKERLLMFDVGLERGGPRVKAEQYLYVDSTQPNANRNNWIRHFGTGMMGARKHLPPNNGWTVNGLKKVPPSASVTRVNPWNPGAGEHFGDGF